MYGLQVGDFVSGSGGVPSRTLPVATGHLPLVVADPVLSSIGAILYPPQVPTAGGGLSNVPLQMQGADGRTQYELNFGTAIALGHLSVMKNGKPEDKTVAVVVGSGRSSATGRGPFLVVVDISKPYVPGTPPPYVPGTPFLPQAIGFLKLPSNPSDVLLYGNHAFVGTGTDILEVDLTDPTNLRSAGWIKGNFGNRLALTSDGFLIGTGDIPGAIRPSAVKTVARGNVITLQKLPTIFAEMIAGDPYSPPDSQRYRLLSPLTLTVCMSKYDSSITTGDLFLSGNNFAMPPRRLDFHNTGCAEVTLEKGTELLHTVAAKPSVATRRAMSTCRPVPLPSAVRQSYSTPTTTL